MSLFRTSVLAAAVAGAPVLAAQQCPAGAVIAVVNATLLTMDSPVVVRGATVVVREGRIASLTGPIPAGACRIDAAGRVLMPGLTDLHVHTDSSELRLFVVNGVTMVRELNGSPGMLALRAKVARGEVLGPRILASSPLLVGAPLRYRHQVVATPEDARRLAREYKAAGYDFLKIYDGLSRAVYDAFVEEARALGIPLDGHVPAEVGLARVIEAGQALQHMDKSAFALSGHRSDTATYAEARRLFSGARVWVTPTIASLKAMDMMRTVEYAAWFARPEMAYLDEGTRGWWSSLSGSQPARPRSAFFRYQMGLLRVMRESGARFTLGTDAANPLMVAGFSVHDELASLVADGGFTPYEALEIATRNAGEFLGEPLTGRLVVGAPADLLLVDGNPLDDLSTLRRPFAVMLRGRWISRTELDALVPPPAR